MIDLMELPNGKLRVSIVGKEPKDYIDFLLSDICPLTFIQIWQELFDEAGLTGDGWSVVSGDAIGGLTEAPIILLGFMPPEDYDWDGYFSNWTYEKGWWLSNYAVINEFDILKKRGYIDFDTIPDN